MVNGVSPLVVVLPTGGGKSLLALAAAALDASQKGNDRPAVTVLVLPFRALIENMLVRAAQAGVNAAEWRPGQQGELQRRGRLAGLLLVSADSVGSSHGEFLSYAALLARQHILQQVVIDEYHTVVKDSS